MQTDLATNVLPDFPTVITADVDGSWNSATMLLNDTLHPNAIGHAYITSRIEVAIGTAITTYRQGLHQLASRDVFSASGIYIASGATYTFTGATAPSAPSGVIAATAQQATVSWTRGTDGRATITSQVIQASSDGGTIWNDVLTGIAQVATSATIATGLTATTSYIFRVLAINAIGRGTPSAASSPVAAGAAPIIYAADPFTAGTVGSPVVPTTTPPGAKTWVSQTSVGTATWL